MSSRDREHKIRVALRMLFAYPTRPESMLPPSPSVDQLRQVLRDAPSVGAYLRTKGPSKYEGIEEHYHGEDGEYTYSWSSSYLEKLYGALIEIIEIHGTGDDGWATARWEVYDKVLTTSFSIFLSQRSFEAYTDTWISVLRMRTWNVVLRRVSGDS